MTCSVESRMGAGVFSVDRIEGQYLHGLSVAESLSQLAHEDLMIDQILNRLQEINPTRASMYKTWLGEMRQSMELIEDFYFMPLPDSGTTMIPEGCRQEQAAIFITSPNSQRIRFIFNKNLWEKASALDRAYLLLHELIYREAILPENQQPNSVSARYFNAWLFHRVDTMTQFDLIDLLQALKFKNTDFGGISIVLTHRATLYDPHLLRLTPILRYPNSKQIKRAVLGAAFSVQLGNEVFKRVCNDSLTVFQSRVEFYLSGKIKVMHFEATDEYVPIDATPRYTETNCSFHGKNYFEFDENGTPTKIEFRELTGAAD